jgi:hypothetical protein
MFGRLFKISIIDNSGNSVVLVDTKNRKYNDYIANGLNLHFGQRTIDYQFWYY